MPLFAIGFNYRSAPIAVRERIAFATDTQRSAIEGMQSSVAADEVALLSTCNRTEVYLRSDRQEVLEHVAEWLGALPTAAGVDLSPYFYRLREEAVVRHAFRVASGLDSMVLGEPQILGQIKHAAKVAGEAGVLGGSLERLFQETFKVAKRVRTETAVGAASVSMAAAALKLSQQLFGDLDQTRILFIGVGEMIELAATHFSAQSPKHIAVANRTLERGRELANRFNASAMTLQEIPERLHEFDIVISSTASTLPIIGKGLVERALKARRRKPMFMVDLAVPRDIEAEVGDLDDVFLYTLDALGKIISQNQETREAAVKEADAIIDVAVNDFMAWLAARASVPVIQQLRSRADEYRQFELERARKSLARGEPAEKVLELLASGLTNKFLHHPLAALNRASGAERAALANALEKIYPEQEEP